MCLCLSFVLAVFALKFMIPDGGILLVKLIPEVRNEFIYGKASLYDEHHEVIGVSEENSIWCKGAVNNGYSEEIARRISDEMSEKGGYLFNRSH